MSKTFKFLIWLVVHLFCVFIAIVLISYISELFYNVNIYGGIQHLLIEEIDNSSEAIIVLGLFLFGYNLCVLYNWLGLFD